MRQIPDYVFEDAGVAQRPSNIDLEREQSMKNFIMTGA